METLRVEHVSKYYGQQENRVIALNDVSFSVTQGEFIAIVGPSGSGKSTLLHLLGGVDVPSAGRIIVDGQDLSKMKESQLAIFRRRQIGLIYQFYNLIPILNVKENILLPLLLDGRKVILPISDLWLIPSVCKIDCSICQINFQEGNNSGYPLLAHSLTNLPSSLADEPTGNLDSKNSAEILSLFHHFHREYHQTLILITHDHNIALQADRILSMQDGSIVKDEVIRR